MDFYPETIPEANIEKAAAEIAECETSNVGGPVLDFERGWLLFLKKDSRAAIHRFTEALAVREELPDKRFYIVTGYRNIGLCYDLLIERSHAVRFYREGIAAADALGITKANQASFFQNYLKVPHPHSSWPEARRNNSGPNPFLQQ